jgi:hypothetical protein
MDRIRWSKIVNPKKWEDNKEWFIFIHNVVNNYDIKYPEKYASYEYPLGSRDSLLNAITTVRNIAECYSNKELKGIIYTIVEK